MNRKWTLAIWIENVQSTFDQTSETCRRIKSEKCAERFGQRHFTRIILPRKYARISEQHDVARIEICRRHQNHVVRTVVFHEEIMFLHNWITGFWNCRAFFGFAFLLVLFLSLYFISNVYEKWSASPVIVTLGATFTSITDLPFPAVTICNINKGFLILFSITNVSNFRWNFSPCERC